MSCTITFEQPGALPFELDTQPTPSGELRLRVDGGARSAPPELRNIRPGDLVVGIGGKNVETPGLVAITSLLSTATRPISVSFVRPVVGLSANRAR